MSALSYRSDIDGLRAIAVLSVIVCHANHVWLPGGFVGVDIFFVISGFLITSIIYREMQAGEFSFAAFYVRRIKRILPVFFLVLFVVLLTGMVLLIPSDLVFLVKSARFAALFASNIHFTSAVDYFAPAAIESPLIHTWSLAVEEQYYFVWPILLIVISGYRHLLVITLLLATASFVLASFLALNTDWAMWSFYQLPTRMGELLIGSMLAIYRPLKTPARLAVIVTSITGVVFLVLSFLLLDKQSVFPGYNALWPCLGAALLIYAGSAQANPSFMQHILSSTPFVFVGKISYSLYLWHWPVLAFVRYYTMQNELTLPWLVASALLTLVLSVLSWKYVEQPARREGLKFTAAGWRYFLAPAVVVLAFSAYVKYIDGDLLGNDRPELTHVVINDLGCVHDIRPDCHMGSDTGRARTVMFGDSHAKHYSVVFDGIARQQDVAIDFFSVNSCPFMLDRDYNKGGRCSRFTEYVSSHFDKYDNIVVVLRWSQYFQLFDGGDAVAGQHFYRNLLEFSKEQTRQGRKVFLVAQVPEYANDVQRSFRLGNVNNSVKDRYQAANRMLQNLAAHQQGVFFVGFDPVLVQWKNGIVDGLPAYLDSHHLNEFGQRKLLAGILSRDDYDWLLNEFQHGGSDMQGGN